MSENPSITDKIKVDDQKHNSKIPSTQDLFDTKPTLEPITPKPLNKERRYKSNPPVRPSPPSKT